MMRTSELKRQLEWERKHQEILINKAERYKAKGLIHNGDIILGIHECYDDCMNSYNNSVARENAYIEELVRRKELPKKIGMQVASAIIAIITLGQFHLMQ